METTDSEDSETDAGLTPDDLRLLRERLERIRNSLQARLRREQAAVVEEGEERLSEPMDAAEQTRGREDAVLFTDRDRELMREVENALSKLDTGGYGLSELSGRPIGFRRLLAVPWAGVAADETED